MPVSESTSAILLKEAYNILPDAWGGFLFNTDTESCAVKKCALVPAKNNATLKTSLTALMQAGAKPTIVTLENKKIAIQAYDPKSKTHYTIEPEQPLNQDNIDLIRNGNAAKPKPAAEVKQGMPPALAPMPALTPFQQDSVRNDSINALVKKQTDAINARPVEHSWWETVTSDHSVKMLITPEKNGFLAWAGGSIVSAAAKTWNWGSSIVEAGLGVAKYGKTLMNFETSLINLAPKVAVVQHAVLAPIKFLWNSAASLYYGTQGAEGAAQAAEYSSKVSSTWQGVKDFFVAKSLRAAFTEGGWSGVGSLVWNTVKAPFIGLWNSASACVTEAASAVGEAASYLWNAAGDLGSAAWQYAAKTSVGRLVARCGGEFVMEQCAKFATRIVASEFIQFLIARFGAVFARTVAESVAAEEIAAGAAATGGGVPIAAIINIAIVLYTAWELYEEWQKMQAEKNQPKPAATAQ